MDCSASGLVEYARSILPMRTAYMWGGAMRLITESYIAAKAAQYPYWYTASNRSRLLALSGKGYYGVDCAGLIKSYYWGGTGSKHYRAETDLEPNQLFRSAKESGPRFSLPEIPGLCVWANGRVGVYEGKGMVIEAADDGTLGGVRRTRFWSGGWTHWFQCPHISYGESGPMTQEAFNRMFARAMEDYKRAH